MNPLVDKNVIRFYLWVGLAFTSMWLIGALITYPETVWVRSLNYIWASIFVIPLNFILFEYTIPFISRKRTLLLYNILIGILLLWIHLIFYSYGLYLWRMLGIRLHVYTELRTFTSVGHTIQYNFSYSVASIFFFGICRHIYHYIKLKHSSQQLRIEKQQAELNYLRSQTNPHFLFNTLNNIYSLARDKDDLAPESILRLSKILRFMLYETSGKYISIEQELKIISDYIDLEKLRYDESLQVHFNYDIEDMKQAIPPLLLIPLVENAFKHGVSETRNQPFVDIHLSINNRQVKFHVRNSADGSGERSIKENIGLSNLRRQLELLYKDYDLSLEQSNHEFNAILKINLASHV